MSLKMLDSTATTRTIKRLSLMDETVTLRVLQQLTLQDETDTLRPIFSSLTAVAAPSTLSAPIATPYPSDATTGSTTATPTGGVGPYTYSWILTEQNDAFWSIGSPTADTTTLTCLFLAPGAFASAVAECTVTDSLGSTAVTNTVAADALNTG